MTVFVFSSFVGPLGCEGPRNTSHGVITFDYLVSSKAKKNGTPSPPSVALSRYWDGKRRLPLRDVESFLLLWKRQCQRR